jgi:hypothetical protein
MKIRKLRQGTLAKGESSVQLTLYYLVSIRCFWYWKHYYFFAKQAILMRRSIVLSLPLQLAFPGLVEQSSCTTMSLSYRGRHLPQEPQLLGNSYQSTTRCQCYKLFFLCYWFYGTISQSVSPWQAFCPNIIFVIIATYLSLALRGGPLILAQTGKPY